MRTFLTKAEPLKKREGRVGHDLLGRLSPYVRQCGDIRRPAWRMGGRKLLDYLLVYIADGRGVFSIGGDRWEAEPDDLFWIPPNTVHSMEGYPPSMLCPYAHFDLVYAPRRSHWEFTIPGGTLDLAGLRHRMHPPVKEPLIKGLSGRIRSHTNRRVGAIIREICAEAARAQPYSMLRMSGMMLEVLAEILRGKASSGSEGDAHLPLVEEAADYLHEHCQEDVHLDAAAEIAGISASHFRRLFVRHLGRSPREYLARARVEKAKSLMLGSTLSLDEVARAVGFASVHGFSRAFRRIEGIPPREYRTCAGSPALDVEGRRKALREE